MRNVNALALSALDYLDTNGSLIDANQLAQASFHAVFSDATAAGTFKIQGSNDVAPARNMALIDGFAPTHWVDVPNQSASIVAGAQALLTLAPSPYRWLRAVYTNTGAGAQTITTVADESATAQTMDITTGPDIVGSLNNTYFLLYSANNLNTYYVWFNVAGTGTDPALPGKIGIQVPILLNATADDVAVACTGPIAAASGGVPFNCNASTNNALIYNLQTGPATAAVDGLVPTGFAFNVSVAGASAGTVLLSGKYFLINAGNSGLAYYAWIDTGSSVDPAPPGKIGIQVPIQPRATAIDVATAVAAYLNGADWSAGSIGAVVTATNIAAGPYVPAADVNTTFAFALTGGGSGTINVRMNGIGV